MPSNVLLVVLDGVGEAPDGPGNALRQAQTPFLDALYDRAPWTLLRASGNAVGAPEGFDGSSEPGHLTIGAGRVVWQPFEEINQAIKHGSLHANQPIQQALQQAKAGSGRLHLIGMVSDGGVHSHLDHCVALVHAARDAGVREILIHAIADGRDVAERSVQGYLQRLCEAIAPSGTDARVVSLIGRYYAMDRDTNWDRTQVAYDLYARGQGETISDVADALEAYFARAAEGTATDYYLPAFRLNPAYDGMHEGDSVIFWNFRSDRARQLAAAFTPGPFTAFARHEALVPPRIAFCCLGPHSETLPVAFPTRAVEHNLGTWLGSRGVRQLRVAETEKFAHVTFFFNSQVQELCNLEERVMVPSKKVATFAEAPEMSAAGVTDALCDALGKREYGLIVCNYANGDLVGHSGNFHAAVRAVEVLDQCLARLVPCAEQNGYTVVITADHGNVESMLRDHGEPNPSHTSNLVRCAIIGAGFTKATKLREGMGLSAVAPTVLGIMGIEPPAEMDPGLL